MQDVVDAQPVHGEKQSVRVLRSFPRRARPRMSSGVLREPFQFPLSARVTEHHLMPGARKQRPEFTPHQSRTENANSHAAPRISADIARR